jgi:RNA polymerase sigma-70 factor (ECF subfamily)
MTQQDATNLVSSLFDSWYPRLVNYAYRLTNNTALAQDAVQDSFMQLYRALELGKDIHNPKAWTFCVVRREIGKQMRNYGVHEVSFDGLDLGNTLVGPRGDQPDLCFEYDEIARILSRLSPREYEVILLRMESLKCREIASELGISVNSVTTLLARALRKLTEIVISPTQSLVVEEGSRHVQKTLQ